MKKILILLLLFMLAGCKSNSFNKDFPYMKDVKHHYKKIGYDDAMSLLKNGTGVLLIAFNSNLYDCPYCKTVIPLLNEELYDEVDVIYYLDIYQMRTNKTQEYIELLNYLDERVELLERDNEKIVVVPDVYFVRNGMIIGHHIGTIYNEEKQFIIDLSKEEKEELRLIYKNLYELWKY